MQNSLFPDFEVKQLEYEHRFFGNIIHDKGSKYSVSIGKINSVEEVKSRLKTYCSDKYFIKATHNSYAYRIQDENKIIYEGKQDDGES